MRTTPLPAPGALTDAHGPLARSVWENERSYLSDADISRKLLDLWRVMDSSIHAGVSSSASFPPLERGENGQLADPALLPLSLRPQPRPSSPGACKFADAHHTCTVACSRASTRRSCRRRRRPPRSLPPPQLSPSPSSTASTTRPRPPRPRRRPARAHRSSRARSTTRCRRRRGPRASSPPSTGSAVTPSPSTRSTRAAGGSSRRRRMCVLALSDSLSSARSRRRTVRALTRTIDSHACRAPPV